MTRPRFRTRLRFTGEVPTAAAVRRYANWMFAYDEESRLGQDESTVRPDDDQKRMSGQTVYSAADLRGPKGRTRLGLLHRFDDLWDTDHLPSSLYVYVGDDIGEVEFAGGSWRPSHLEPTLHFNDYKALPLHVIGRRASASTRVPHRLVLMPDGAVITGTVAEKVKVTVPPIVRPADIDASNVDLSDAGTGIVYRVRNGKRTRIGTSEWSSQYSKDRRMLESSSRIVKDDPERGRKQIETRYISDARTLEVVSMWERIDGREYTVSRTRKGRHKLPRGAFSGSRLLGTMRLRLGLRIAAPVYLASIAALRNKEFSVEAHEVAPGHRREAWRVRSCLGGTIARYTWYDVDSGGELATSLVSRATDYEELTIFRRSRARRK